MKKITIEITGEQASGKTVTLKTICKILEREFGCKAVIQSQHPVLGVGDRDIAEITIPEGVHVNMAMFNRA